MTAKRRLLPMSQVKEALDFLRSYGVDVTTCSIDIRGDGITVTPPAAAQPDEYEKWSRANPL